MSDPITIGIPAESLEAIASRATLVPATDCSAGWAVSSFRLLCDSQKPAPPGNGTNVPMTRLRAARAEEVDCTATASLACSDRNQPGRR